MEVEEKGGRETNWEAKESDEGTGKEEENKRTGRERKIVRV